MKGVQAPHKFLHQVSCFCRLAHMTWIQLWTSHLQNQFPIIYSSFRAFQSLSLLFWLSSQAMLSTQTIENWQHGLQSALLKPSNMACKVPFLNMSSHCFNKFSWRKVTPSYCMSNWMKWPNYSFKLETLGKKLLCHHGLGCLRLFHFLFIFSLLNLLFFLASLLFWLPS